MVAELGSRHLLGLGHTVSDTRSAGVAMQNKGNPPCGRTPTVIATLACGLGHTVSDARSRTHGLGHTVSDTRSRTHGLGHSVSDTLSLLATRIPCTM